MANPTQIVAKLARNAQSLGLTVVSQSFAGDGIAQAVISNGSNNLTITYLLASIQSPMGGVNGNVSPFLGIGVANPGQIVIQSTATGADTIADVIDGQVAAQVLQLCSGMANNIWLCNGTAVLNGPSGPPTGGYVALLQGSSDWLGMGQ